MEPVSTTNNNRFASSENIIESSTTSIYVSQQQIDPYNFIPKPIFKPTTNTVVPAQLKYVITEFKDILQSTPVEVDEFEEEDMFSIRIIDWIEKYNFAALDTIFEFYASGELNEKTISHILMALGNANNSKTYNKRLEKLEEFLKSSSPKIRYGAIIGISNLDDPEAIRYLSNALEKERIPVLKGTLKSVIKQLKKTESE